MTYRLGNRSLRELQGVHPDLVRVVKHAITITEVDFSVHDGIRTDQEQKRLYDRGASTLDGVTKRSKHQLQVDGSGHAVDLVPYINGKLRWEWSPIYSIADAVREAAELHSVRIRWGGHWGELTGTGDVDPEDLVDDYVRRRRAQGRRAFIDGPHYEILL